jgi:5-(carboxyamino)imidazole ribonucleotide synthase
MMKPERITMLKSGSRLAPGSTIGILGGGQLARMLALAAAPLGFKCHIYAPEADSPAFDVSAARTLAAYDDKAALAAFAKAVDVVTYEFENVPVACVTFLEAMVPVRPGSKALGVAQDRLAEKALANQLGARTAPFAPVLTRAELDAAIVVISLPAVLKTTRMGYDGKGQAKIMSPADIAPAFVAMKGQQAVLEGFITFRCEVSVIAARGLDGAFAAFAVTENEHRNHILHRSLAPARILPRTVRTARAIAKRMAAALDYIGVFAVEFFVMQAADGEVLFVNEIAPRVHNSGHWTQDGAVTSQFEQHIRAIAGWPLGMVKRRGARSEMINLIGDDVKTWPTLAADPGAKLHLYGKTESRVGRKMGHVNRVLGVSRVSGHD